MNDCFTYYNAFKNSTKGWGDVLNEKDENEETKMTVEEALKIANSLNIVLSDSSNSYSNIWKQRAYQVEVDRYYSKIYDECIELYQKYIDEETDKYYSELKTIDEETCSEPKTIDERKVLNYNDKLVIDYIAVDRLCSTIWNKKLIIHEMLKTTADKKSVLEQELKHLNDWLVASEKRFAIIEQIKDAGDFDFEQCFKVFYPEEGEHNHCAEMQEVYTSVRKWIIPKLKAKLKKL